MENLSFNRTPDECEKIWNNLLDPGINRKKFTPEEDVKLTKLASIYDEKNWKVIAQELGTNRTSIQCITRYQSHLNKKLVKKYWTEEEDNKLIELIAILKIGEYIPWTRVVAFMEGRTLLQLQNRWDRCLKPQKRDSDWSIEEDAILLLSVAVIKLPLWGKISNLLYGRTSYYCRERYTNTLDPEIITGTWTPKDDRKLLRCLAEHGERWGKISRAFRERTDNMVNNRCKILRRYKPSLYLEILKKGLNYDFTKLPKKPLAPSKVCSDINTERERVRKEAFSVTLAAAKKVLGDKIDLSGVRKFKDFGNLLNEASLDLIAAELLPDDRSELGRPRLKYHTLSESENTETEIDDSDYDDEISFKSDEEDEYDVNDDIEVKVEDDDMYVKTDIRQLSKDFDLERFMVEFDRRILPNAAIGYKNYTPEINLKTKKRDLEFSALIRHVFKMYNLSIPLEYNIEGNNATYYNAKYEKDIPFVMDMFVMAHIGGKSLPVMPPNLTNLKGGKMLCLIYSHLCNWINNLTVNDVNIYNSFVSKSPNDKVLCYNCSAKFERDACKANDPNVPGISDNNLEDDVVCECEAIMALRKKRLIFMYRFFVLFAWPLLLRSIMPSKYQVQELIVKPSKQSSQLFQKSLKKNKRKREVFTENDDSDEND